MTENTDTTDESNTQESKSTTFVKNITSKNGLLSALSAALLVLSVPILVYLGATGAITLGAVSGMWAWAFATIFGMAAVRLFGKSALEAIQQARGK